MVVHLEHDVASVVEVHDQTFDRTRVTVVGLIVAQERDAARDPSSLFAVVAEHPGGPGVDLHAIDHVRGDSPAGKRGQVLGIRANRADRLRGLVHEQGRADRLDFGPRFDHPRADVDDRLDHAALGTGNDDTAQTPLDGIAGLPPREHLLHRFVQHDAREQRAVGDPAALAQDRDRALDLVTREHLERMRHLGHCRLGVRHSVPTTRNASAARPSGRPAACAIAPVQLRTTVAVASGSGSWLLCESSASILRSTASVIST